MRDIFQLMVDNFEIASRNYQCLHKSRHWDKFPADYLSVIRRTEDWPNLRRNHIAAGMGGNAMLEPHFYPEARSRYRHLVNVCGKEFIETVIEGDIGNPWCTIEDGFKVNHHDMLLCFNAWQLRECAKMCGIRTDDRVTIIDIGGGFGGFSLKIKKIFPNSRIILLDIPETNAIQTYYLHEARKNDKILGMGDFENMGEEPFYSSDFDFAILPGWLISSFPSSYADIFINMRSFMEMYMSIVGYYIKEIERVTKCRGLFYCVNRYMKTTTGERNRIKDYPLDDRWIIQLSESMYDHDHEHQLACIRSNFPGAVPTRNILRQLPPYTIGEAIEPLSESFRRMGDVLFSRDHDIQLGYIFQFIDLLKRPVRPLKRFILAPRRVATGEKTGQGVS